MTGLAIFAFISLKGAGSLHTLSVFSQKRTRSSSNFNQLKYVLHCHCHNGPRLGTKFRNQVWPHGHIFLKDPGVFKGAGVFRRPGQNVEDLCNFGTSRTSNELTLCRYT